MIKPQRHSMVTNQIFTWQHWLILIVFTALVLGNALSTILITYQTRQQYAKLQQLERQQDELQADWSRLLLEESTWSNPARIEQIARQQLNMIVPNIKAIEVLPP